jgi:hypothetical protein
MLCLGCVLADPPEHGKAEQTPPMLYANQAVPPVYEVLNVSPGDRISFNVPLRSEDVGEALQADLYLNYSITNPDRLEATQTKSVFISPGTFEDRQRDVNMQWDVRVGTKPGCHQLTIAVTHIGNAQIGKLDDIATVTWWVNVSDNETSPNQMKDCPTNKGSTN